MFKFIKEYIGLYALLFFLSYCSIYNFPFVTPLISALILWVSYYILLKRKRLEVVLILILYSRCLSGFVIPHNKLFFDLFNILANIVPILLYFYSCLLTNKTTFNFEVLKKFKFTGLFFLLITLSFIINFSTAYDLITKRYLPFALFTVLLFFFNHPNDFDFNALIRFFRASFLAVILIYFGPNFLYKMTALIESDSVFGTASPPRSFSLVYFSLERNLGFTWDHRIMAILAYLFLMLSLTQKPKYYALDILLSLSVVLTSTSRGGMITYFLILMAFFFQKYRKFFSLGVVVLVALTIMLYALIKLNPSNQLSAFLISFNPKAEHNAMTQREFFSNYSLVSFKESPIIGHGVGHLSSVLIDRNLIVDGAVVPAVGDAYWYVLLAEMGVIGFLLYVLFLLEVFYSSSILNVALLLGFSIQLLGTDIPDIRFFYLAILILVYQINARLKLNLEQANKTR